MQSPGGITYHQAPALGAPELNAFSSIVPQEMLVGSPSPRKASDASARIATAMISTVLAKISGSVLGRMWVLDDVAVAGPQRPRALDEGALAQGQDLGADDAAGPGPRGQADDRDQHRQRRDRAAARGRSSGAASGSPGTSSRARRGCGRSSRRSSRRARPTSEPSTAEIIAAAKPTTIEIRAPASSWLKTSEPCSVVPRMWLQARRGEHVETRRVGVVGGEQLAEDREEAEEPDAPRARSGRARCRAAARAGSAPPRAAPGGASAGSDHAVPLIAPAPAGRGRSRGCRRARLAKITPTLKIRKVPCRTGKSLSLIAS